MSVRPVTLGDGSRRFEVRWREGDRNRARRFLLRADAAAFDREVTRRKQLGPMAVRQLTVKGPTLDSWIVQRWGPEHAAGLEAKTRSHYASTYVVHIEPWLGHLPLQELTVGRLREWQADRLAAGVTPNSIMKARTVLSSVLRHAAESEAIPGNALTLVRTPKRGHRDDVVAMSPMVVETLRAALRPRPRDATIVSLLSYSGLRPGELRVLRWGDIGQTIRVQRAAAPDGTPKTTKTRRGKRNVRLLEPLAEDLAAWREHRGGRAGDLVFPAQDAAAMSEEDWRNWRSRVWVPVWAPLDLAELGFPKRPRPYDMRHSFASLLLAEGRSVHYVADQLGHDAALTLSTYGHLIAEYADLGDIDAADEIRKARARTR